MKDKMWKWSSKKAHEARWWEQKKSVMRKWLRKWVRKDKFLIKNAIVKKKKEKKNGYGKDEEFMTKKQKTVRSGRNYREIV